MRRAALAAGMIVLLALIYGAAAYSSSDMARHIVHDADINALVRLQQARPMLEGRAAIGEADAQVTVIAYLDPASPATGEFMRQTYPLLEAYADNGTIRYYPRIAITYDDWSERSARYLQAKLLACAHLEDPGHIAQQSARIARGEYLKTDSAPDALLAQCVQDRQTPELWNDVIETERTIAGSSTPLLLIGIDGRGLMSIPGIASRERIERAIGQYALRVGE